MQMSQAEVTDLLHKLAQEIMENNEKQLKEFFNKLMQNQEKNNKELIEVVGETISKRLDKFEITIKKELENVIERNGKLLDKISDTIGKIKDYERLLQLNTLNQKQDINIDNNLMEKIIGISKETGTFIKENELLRIESDILKEKLQSNINKTSYTEKEIDDLADTLNKLFPKKDSQV
ncbi:hypothetical protein [Clostridium beijerinckii]|uniref:Biotin synthase-related radical SAM superfamily protein n=1 Tax=Clostridium beijerinckii TaxID=1520 RepID=A0AAE5H9G9_CLOBE|nr:hypothetical protein [Clostridium beijerinckii]NSB17468.1 biotin synthase-related radical SAM superfamily protein [Clostridium beijerinckii]OOM28421.1 hypothetical protein CLOBE_26770 [Clostridium beijerinckii]